MTSRQKIIRAVDLFCGAGGTSTGAMKAAQAAGARLDLLAVNHWSKAIDSHTLNHPTVRHMCESLDNIRPQTVVPGGHLNILMASPECTHHSNAAGGRPRNDQSRATAWHICRWAADLKVDNIFIENVPEFQNWGPLGKNGLPLKRRKGETFRAFIAALRSMGYNLEYREVDAANSGDPTNRLRLVILARRGKPIIWPTPSHGEDRPQPWRTAREIIDWSIKGKSIFNRRRPIVENTLRKVVIGLQKFSGSSAEPFLVTMEHGGNARSIDRPMPTITTAKGGSIALVQPFLVKYYGSATVCSLDKPLDTITTKARFMLVEPKTGEAGQEYDVLIRMLKPHEYAACMSFPSNYRFVGTVADQIKQIGNAVPINLAAAHIGALL